MINNNQVSQKNNIEQRDKTSNISQYYLGKLKNTNTIKNILKDVKINSNTKSLHSLYESIDVYRNNINIPDSLFLKVARLILRISQPNNIGLFFVYRKFTKNIDKDIKGEIYLFIQSLLSLNREGDLYQILKRFV